MEVRQRKRKEMQCLSPCLPPLRQLHGRFTRGKGGVELGKLLLLLILMLLLLRWRHAAAAGPHAMHAAVLLLHGKSTQNHRACVHAQRARSDGSERRSPPRRPRPCRSRSPVSGHPPRPGCRRSGRARRAGGGRGCRRRRGSQGCRREGGAGARRTTTPCASLPAHAVVAQVGKLGAGIRAAAVRCRRSAITNLARQYYYYNSIF